MENLTDRFLWMSIGAILGLIVGYFVRDFREMKREVHELHENTGGASEASTPSTAAEAPQKPRRLLSGQSIAIGIVVLLCAYSTFIAQAAYSSDKNKQHDILVSQCLAGTDSRNAQRQIIDAIYQLAIGAIERDKDAPPLTKTELKAYNKYIDRVNAFRSSTYALLKPSRVCRPYVEDVSVKPSTPDQPHLVPQ